MITPEAPSILSPSAWRAATIDDPARWYYPLSGGALTAIHGTIRDLRGRPIQEVTIPDGARQVLRESLEPIVAALEAGRGFGVITGLDVARYSDEEQQAAYWAVGHALGRPFEQNVQGTVLYSVRDTGMSVDQGARFSVTNAESSFHTDNSFGETVLDYVGLLCLRTARSGGVNQVVSGYSAVEELRAEHPDAYGVLCRPFHVDRRGGVREGESPTVRMPVIEWRDGELLFRYLRYWIEVGHQKAGEPLTPEQVRALDTLDAVLERPDLRAEFSLERGQMFWINNRWILHNRTAFEDHTDPELRRHYVRLWVRRET